MGRLGRLEASKRQNLDCATRHVGRFEALGLSVAYPRLLCMCFCLFFFFFLAPLSIAMGISLHAS
jgi:hypothetical protein